MIRLGSRRCLIVSMLLGMAATPAPAVEKQPLLSKSDARELVQEFRLLASRAEERLAERSSDRVNVDSILEQAGFEADRLYRWISQNTALTPYRGALRGAAGVLMDRRGNSLDRSLALGRLLEDAGYEVRLARTSLPIATAEQVLNNVITDGKRTLAGKAGDYGADAGKNISVVGDRLVEITGLKETEPRHEQARLVEMLRDHWWVEGRLGTKWESYDPVFPADAGSQRPEPQSYYETRTVPEHLKHRVTLDVLFERWADGATLEESALTVEHVPVEHQDTTSVELTLSPYSRSWLLDRDDIPESVSELWLADTATHWRPVARIGEQRFPGEWISRDGNITSSPIGSLTVEKLKSAKAALDENLTEASEEPDSHLTGMWLQYTVTRPGRAPIVVRREIFDLLNGSRSGPDKGGAKMELSAADIRRRGLALQGRTVILPFGAAPSLQTVRRSILELLVENRDYFIAIARKAAGQDVEQAADILAEGGTYRPVDLLSVGALRALWNARQEQTYIDSVNVIATHFFLVQNDGALETRTGIDVVFNGVGVLPDRRGVYKRARLHQGVVDTAAENALLDGDDSGNTYRLFEKHLGTGKQWLTPGNPDELERLAGHVPPNDRSRILDAMERGHRVVIAPTVSRMGEESYVNWWSIDPVDGRTLGRGYRGWGAEITERVKMEIVVDSSVKEAYRRMGRKAVCHGYSMAFEAVTMRLADKMMFAGTRPWNARPKTRFAKACYKL